MKKVYIKKIPYTIDCDLGTQDVCWLAMSACYEHGNNTFPVTKYVPCMATNKDGEILHPKLVLCKNDKKVGSEIYVKVRHKDSDPLEGEMTAEEKQWFEKAFGNERFFMDVKIRMIPSNELKRDYLFWVTLSYKIHPPLMTFFPDAKEMLTVELEEIGNKNKNELYQGIIKLPFGQVDYIKLHYKDKEGNEKETTDFRNKVTIDRFPEPLLYNEREVLIRQKEAMIKSKESALRSSIKNIEQEKESEAQRLKELQNFLASLPFSIDDIFEYTNKEIPDATNDMIDIFSYLEKDEYFIFRKLFEIFSFYSKFYEESHTNTIDIEALMSFYKSYFDFKKDELASIVSDFKKFYISRVEQVSDYNFLDFIFSIIYLLYNIQIYRNISIEGEFHNIVVLHDKKLEDDGFRALYSDDIALSQVCNNIDFLKKFFQSFSQRKFETYYEMSPNQFLNFIKEVGTKKNFDTITLIEKKFIDDICFFDFLERLVATANKAYTDPNMEHWQKISELIEAMQEIWGDNIDLKK